MFRTHAIGVTTVLIAAHAHAASPAPGGTIVTDPFYGSAQTSVALDVPAFHGVEPRLSLSYSSSGGNRAGGVGWSLGGIGAVERASAGQGAPRYDATDVFLLGGQELVPCAPGVDSPSCSSGGTHATEIESYMRIVRDAVADRWVVTRPDGVVETYVPVYAVTRGTFRWGLSTVRDTKGNTVTYSWTCDPGADCYPSTIAYGPYVVTLFGELRPDPIIFANGEYIGITRYRLRSVRIHRNDGANIRAYKLVYATSGAATGRSVLASVQKHGRDVVIDSSGSITGGTALPAETFQYQGDPAAGTFTLVPTPAPTPPGTVENALPFTKRCVEVDGTTIYKPQTYQCNTNTWDSGVSSTRAMLQGDGYMEFRDGCRHWSHGDLAAGLSTKGMLSNNDFTPSYHDIDFGILILQDETTYESFAYAVEQGVTVAYLGTVGHSVNDVWRVAVEGGSVRYKLNGVVLHTSARAPTYPLRAVAAFKETGVSGVRDIKISGQLVDVAGWCPDGLRAQGDYDGDGKTDLLCEEAGAIRVRLGTGGDFAAPTTWWTGPARFSPAQGDFNGDGKTDILGMDLFSGHFLVGLSTGTSFAAQTWSGNGVCRVEALEFRITTGDFNGDGSTDVGCQRTGEDPTWDGVWIGLSTGTSFSHSRWGTMCSLADLTSAGDFDGDGRDDWACVPAFGPDVGAVHVNRSTGASFDAAALTGFYIPAGSCAAEQWSPADVNGDGKGDMLCRGDGRPWLSTGRGFAPQATATSFCGEWGDQLTSGDVTGDGRSDQICNHHAAPANDIEVRASIGNGYAAATTWRASWCLGQIVALDFDADRKIDLYCDDAVQRIGHSGTAGAIPDILIVRGNGFGGQTSFTYAPSSSFPNTNNPPVVPVLTSVTTTDGRGGSATTTYQYQGGLMDRRERRFLGFRWVKETLPCNEGETACPSRETFFKQDYGSASRPERTDRRDGQGRLFTSHVNVWSDSGGVPPYRSLLVGEWSYDYDGSGAACPTWPCANGKRTHVAHAYDAYGNRIRSDEYGEYESAGDETTLESIHRPNAGAYIVNRPAVSRRFAGIGTTGTLLSLTARHYDGATTWDQAPSQGYTTAEYRWLDTNGSFVERTFEYDARGNLVAAIDEVDARTTIAYDAAHVLFPVSTTNAAGETRTLTWDATCGVPTQRVDENASVFTTQYDPLCRATRTDAPLGWYEIRSYVSFGQPSAQHVSIETPPRAGTANHFERTFFDGLGRTYRTASTGSGPMQQIRARTTYHRRGQVATTTAPFYSGAGPDPLTGVATTRYDYDALDRHVATTLPDGVRATRSYGLWSATTIDPHGHAETHRFDAYGRTVAREQARGLSVLTTEMTYDLDGNLVALTDPIGIPWTWEIDSLGRATRRIDPDAGDWTYAYDAAGRATAMMDAKLQRTEFDYDEIGRPRQKRVFAGPMDLPPEETVTMVYGESRPGAFNVGRLTTMVDAAGTMQLDYDALGEATRIVRTLDGTPYSFQTAFNAARLPTRLTYPDGDFIDYTYDRAGRVSSIPGVVTSASYNARGAPLEIANANGTTTTRTYLASRGWLTGISTVSATEVVQSLSYARDPAGLITSIDSPTPNHGWTYEYDDLHRVTQALSTLDATNDRWFDYDDAGRMTYNSKVGWYEYPIDPTAPRPHAPTRIVGSGGGAVGGGNIALAYDANGHVTSVSGARPDTYRWDADRKLIGTGAYVMRYDGFGNRISRGSFSSNRLYPFGDNYEIADGVVTKHIELLGVGLVARRTAGQTFWLHTDHLGSVQAVTDAAGGVQRLAYAPYGDQISGPEDESRTWIGQRHDDESSLTYLHARYYSPEMGVFISPDPSHPLANGVGTSRYAYGLGDPTNGADVDGLRWMMVCRSQQLRWDEKTGSWVAHHSCSEIWIPGPRVARIPGRPREGGGGRPGGGLRPTPQDPNDCATNPNGPNCSTGCQPGDPSCNTGCQPGDPNCNQGCQPGEPGCGQNKSNTPNQAAEQIKKFVAALDTLLDLLGPLANSPVQDAILSWLGAGTDQFEFGAGTGDSWSLFDWIMGAFGGTTALLELGKFKVSPVASGIGYYWGLFEAVRAANDWIGVPWRDWMVREQDKVKRGGHVIGRGLCGAACE